jgi:hypothetical protein
MINISMRKASVAQRRLIITGATCGAGVPPAAFSQPSSGLIFVPAAELPDLARNPATPCSYKEGAMAAHCLTSSKTRMAASPSLMCRILDGRTP